MLKNIYTKICFTCLVFLAFMSYSSAATYKGTITTSGSNLNVRSAPSATSSSLASYPNGRVVTLIDNIKVADGGGCAAGWYRFNYSSTVIGYLCSTYVVVSEVVEPPVVSPDADFETKIKTLFPESYWSKLIDLHYLHPSWDFEPIYTGLNWSDAVASESVVGKSLTNSSNQGYRSTEAGSYNWETDAFTIRESGGWYAANASVVGYYMDVRNFFNEKNIFMFEKLKFDSSYQTTTAISAVFTPTSYLRSYATTFYEAGSTYDINPIHLASRVRQETGNDGGTATSGASFTYNGKTYSGLYNMYNIGATGGTSPVLTGLVWANGGEDGSASSYGRPWKSREQSIKGGAQFLANTYISRGQYTAYLQKFNVDPTAYNPVYTHQYMTNISASVSESTTTYNSYNNIGLLDISFKFAIPVYNNMPASTALPNPGNPNNRLKEITMNGVKLTGFNYNVNTYTYYISDLATSVNIGATTINSKALISGAGTISLPNTTNVVNITCTAENGSTYTYTISIVKVSSIPLSVEDIVNNMNVKTDGVYLSGIILNTEVSGLINKVLKESPLASVEIKNANGNVKTSGILATGDTVKITNMAYEKTYTIVIYGDVNGDGIIDISDLLKVRKHIIKDTLLSGAYLKAAYVSKEASVSIADLLKIRKHIIGDTLIVQ